MTQQALSACPDILDFGIIPLGSSKTMQVVINNPQQEIVSNSTPQKMLLQINTGGKNWLTVESKDPQILQPGVPEVVNVKADTSSLKLGQQTATLTFIANGDTSSKSVEVPVTVNVSPLAAGLSFAVFTNSSKTVPVTIMNMNQPGDKVLNWQTNIDAERGWLVLDRIEGALQGGEVQTVYVTAKGSWTIENLPANLTFTDKDSGNVLATLPAELHVSSDPIYTDNGPKIVTVDKNYLYFDFVHSNPPPKTLKIGNPAGNGPVEWKITKHVDWLIVGKTTGTFADGGLTGGPPQTVR